MAENALPIDESSPGSAGVKRHVPTGVLLLAVIALPLPWINVSCGEEPPGKPRKEYFSVTQSGLQAGAGGTSFHPGSMSQQDASSIGPGVHSPEGAPLLLLYAALTMIGFAAGLFVRGRKERVRIMGGCSVGAFAALLIQLRLGLPLAREIGRRAGGPDALYHLYVEFHYTGWFWLAVSATAAAPIAVWMAHRVRDRSRRRVRVRLRYPVLFRWERIRAPRHPVQPID
jgi:hypothetical protein